MKSSTRDKQRFQTASLTKWSLAALAGGLILGLFGHISASGVVLSAGAVAKVIGGVWIAALQMIALPLALALTLAAVANTRARSVGALSTRAVALFVIILISSGLITLVITHVLLARYSVDPTMMTAMKAGLVIPEAAKTAGSIAGAQWIGLFVPRNIFEAAARGDIFSLLLFAILFALAVNQLPDEHRLPLARAFHAFAQAMLVLVRWVLLVTPLGVFALSFVLALNTGRSLAATLGIYLLIQPAITLLLVVCLYPLSAIAGQTKLRTFARAILPAQIVAISTRSSVASLPALVEGGRAHLGLSLTATDFLLPFSVSLFRISQVSSNLIKLLFLAHVYGLALSPMVVAGFFGTVIIFSFSATGTPNSGGGNGFRMVPVFIAAGIPLEGVIILEAVETIPDIFDTIINVTGQMCATTILSRASRLPYDSVAAAQPVTQVT